MKNFLKTIGGMFESHTPEVKEADNEIKGNCYKTVRHGDTVQFGFDTLKCFEHTIKDPVGFHARPAGEFVKLVSETGCDVTVKNGNKTASGKSVIEIMTLGASKGSRLEVCVSGTNAETAILTLKQFMDEKL